MTLKCIAIDDEPLALNLIKNFAARIPALNLVQTFSDAISGAEFLRNNHVDLLFLDINMPDISGLDLAHALKEKPMIIFTTAYKNFAFEGFELEAVDFLLKPISFDRFLKGVQKAIEQFAHSQHPSEESQESLLVYSEYQRQKIALSDIEYIESSGKYIKFHLVKSKPVLSLVSLSKVLEKLPPNKFRRIHRCFIVPVSKIKSISNQKVRLASGQELPIGKTYARLTQDWVNL